jgi:hypothetical protein
MPDELTFVDDWQTLYETAPFAVVGNAYVVSFDGTNAYADAPGSITITEQIFVS